MLHIICHYGNANKDSNKIPPLLEWPKSGTLTTPNAEGVEQEELSLTAGGNAKRCSHFFVFNKFIYLFIYLFLAALGLCCCAWAFLSSGEQGLLFVVVHGLLTVLASLVVEHGL